MVMLLVMLARLCQVGILSVYAGTSFELKPAHAGIESRSIVVKKFGLSHGNTMIFAQTPGSRQSQDELGAHFNFWPAIYLHSPSGTKVLELNQEFRHFTWADVAGDPDSGHYWGFLEWSVEGPTDQIHIIMTEDSGSHWSQVEPIKKPKFFATVKSFEMDPRGKGILTLEYDGPDATSSASGRTGIHSYSYTTLNWGKSWSAGQEGPFDILSRGESPRSENCSDFYGSDRLGKIPSSCLIKSIRR